MLFVFFIGFGIIGATVFLIGFAKGLREALTEYRTPTANPEWKDERHYGYSAILAVLASSVVIALVGVNGAWIYAGPFLAITTAIGVGIAFLTGDRIQESSRPEVIP